MKLTSSEVNQLIAEEFPLVVREMSDDELARLKALDNDALAREAWRLVCQRAAKSVLDEMIAAGEVIDMGNGWYRKPGKQPG